ncbi:MAG: hypothetical protein J7L66_00235 [Anaerolineaceae bacterium]|nr:hypothetical protein [Anaerolineaceae bacterium]
MLKSGTEVLYMSPTEFVTLLYTALKIIAWISLAGSISVFLITWLRPNLLIVTAIFAFGAIIYAISATPMITEQSSAPHYVYLANAFLHGNVTLSEEPPYSDENDWTYYKNKWSVSFPPAPALLMIPFVAIWKLDFNDVIFTLLLGAFNLALVYRLLSKIRYKSTQSAASLDKTALLLTIAFGFGTVHWWLSTNGQVWFTAHIVATTFLLLALIETFDKKQPMLVAFSLGLSALARPPILFSLPAFIWLLHPQKTWKEIAKGALPLLIIGALMAAYNFARYGNFLELGYSYMQLEDLLAERVAEFGSFNLAFLKENFYHAFLNHGEWRGSFPYFIMDGWGLSLFLSTPLLIYTFFAPWREKRAQALLLAAFLIALPNLLYYNTGYLQAGYRYALDFLPFLFILIALAWRGRVPFFGKILTAISMLTGFSMWINFISLSWELF